jgi:hypothetical protein
MPLRSEKGSLETKLSDLSSSKLKSLSRVNSPIFTENAIRQQYPSGVLPLSGVLAEKSYGHLEIGEPAETLAMQDEIKSQIALEANVWLDAWIPLDWARAYLMLNQVDKSVQAGQEFYKKAKLLKSPHAKSRAYRLLNTIETAGYGDVQAVKDFRYMLDNEEKNG